MKEILFPGATQVLDDAVTASEVALVREYSRGKCLWIGAMDETLRAAVQGLDLSFRLVRRPDEVTCESTRYDTVVLSPAFGEQMGPQAVLLLTELLLEEEGLLILTGLQNVSRVIEQLGNGSVSVAHVGPYGIFTDNSVLKELLGEEYSYATNHFGRLLSDADAMTFWTWFESYLFRFLPPWLSSRNMAILQRGGSLQESLACWKALDASPHIDRTVLEHLLGEHFGAFHEGLLTHMSVLTCTDLVAKLSEVFERRISKTVDFFSLITHEQRVEVTERVAWYWAQDAHRSLSHEEFYLDGIFVPQDIDFMMYDQFLRVLIEAQERSS